MSDVHTSERPLGIDAELHFGFGAPGKDKVGWRLRRLVTGL